jgi:hypothetical protein
MTARNLLLIAAGLSAGAAIAVLLAARASSEPPLAGTMPPAPPEPPSMPTPAV